MSMREALCRLSTSISSNKLDQISSVRSVTRRVLPLTVEQIRQHSFGHKERQAVVKLVEELGGSLADQAFGVILGRVRSDPTRGRD